MRNHRFMKLISQIVLWFCYSLAAGTPVTMDRYCDDFSKYSFVSDGSPNWLVHSGSWEVTNGVLRQVDFSQTETLIFLDKYSFSDCKIKVRFNPSGALEGVRAAGVVFRAVDYQNFYYVHFDSRNSQVVLVRHSPTNIWIVIERCRNVKIANNEWHNAEVSAIGNRIKVSLDDNVLIEKEDRFLSAGRVGLRCGQGIVEFDDYEVTGQPADDSQWVFERQQKDTKTLRLETPRVLATTKGGYFPVMVSLGGNKLGAVIRAGAGHVGIGGRLDWISSDDGGYTWSEPGVLVDSPWDDRNPAIVTLKDGKLLVIYSEASTYQEDGTFSFNAGNYKLFAVESSDNGKTWSAKRAIELQGHDNGSVYGQGIVLTNGDILVPFYWHGGGFIRSIDGGETWNAHIIMLQGCSEIAFLEVNPGEILAICRSDGLFAMRSQDNGNTWTKPERLTSKGQHPASIIKLQDGKVLLTYGSRIRPYGIVVAISDDLGLTFPDSQKAFITWDSTNTDSGYPSAVELENGSVAIIHYAVGSKILPWKIQAQCSILSAEALRNVLQQNR